MFIACHHRTIQVAIGLYAIVAVPGYGWHLVPGCGHDHCHVANESDGWYSHCGHSHHGDHCHHHGGEQAPKSDTEQPPQDGLNSHAPVRQLLACHECGICQFLAKAQVRTVALADESSDQLPEEPFAVAECLTGAEVVASYSARAPPSSAVCV